MHKIHETASDCTIPWSSWWSHRCGVGLADPAKQEATTKRTRPAAIMALADQTTTRHEDPKAFLPTCSPHGAAKGGRIESPPSRPSAVRVRGSGPRPPKAYRRCGGSGDVVRAEAEHMGGRFEASCDAMFSRCCCCCCRCCCCYGPRPVSFGFILAAQRPLRHHVGGRLSWPLRCMWKGGDWVGVEDGTRREL